MAKKKQPVYLLVTYMVGMKKSHEELIEKNEFTNKVISETEDFLLQENSTSVVMHKRIVATEEDIQRLR